MPRFLVGGNWTNASACGSRCVNLRNLSANVNSNYAGRGASGTGLKEIKPIMPVGNHLYLMPWSTSFSIFRAFSSTVKTKSGKPLQSVVLANLVTAIFFKGSDYLKRYGNLFEQICTPENVTLALTKAADGKKAKRGVRRTLARKDAAIAEIVDMLKNQTYHTSPYHKKVLYEPKKRTIYSLPFFPDRIVHHAVMNILEPIWDRLLDSNSQANRKDKGTNAGSLLCMKYTRKYRYVLKCDVHKFYPSIDHAICKSIIRKKLKDPRLLALIDEIIDSANTIQESLPNKNAPIGNLLSQWLGNIYMNELDLWLRHVQKVHAYVRYSDDFVIFSNSKEYLNNIKRQLPDFLATNLKLTLSKADLFPVTRGVDYLGYRHFPKFLLVRKRNARNIKKFIHGVTAGEIAHDKHSQGTVASYHGILKHSNSFNFRKAHGFDEIFSRYKEAPQDEAV